MTVPHNDTLARPEGAATQWVDYGVNCRNVYGGIHFHPVVPAVGPDRPQQMQASPISAARHAVVCSGLAILADVCERASAALLAVGGLTSPDRRQR
ncbi:hypothetical protein ACFH04_14965 [Streptomyces noboritoensis]|uniref:Uncharacterized protein n=1 Tax=Streptomyces noboritoensis TaxID=67337 RepID=A0ABV6TGU3_9ACTN